MSALTVRERLDQAKVFRLEPVDDGSPREIDIAGLSVRASARPEMILPIIGALPYGEPCLLAANGGGSKSTLAMQLVVCASAGVPFFGEPIERMTCTYLSFEDPEPAIHWRLERACYGAGVHMGDLVQRLRIFDGTTWPGAWYVRDERGVNRFTADFEDIKTRVKGSQLIVVDGVSDVFAGNENDRSQVKAFVRGLRTMVPSDGALLLLAHVDKQGVKEGAGSLGYSGSTGWNNSVRSRLYMYRETTGEDGDQIETGRIVLEVKKSNYSKAGGRMLLRYDEQYDVLRREDEPGGTTTRPKEEDELDAIVRVIRKAHEAGEPIPAATAGTRTAHSVAEARDGFPESLKSRRNRPRFYRHLEKLRGNGRIGTESIRTKNRKHMEVLNAPALS